MRKLLCHTEFQRKRNANLVPCTAPHFAIESTINQTIMQSDIMTSKEVADYLRLNEKTVSRLAQTGELPALKIGRQWRFNRTAITAWLAGRVTPPAAPSQPVQLTVADAMSVHWINLDLRGTDRDAVLHELVALIIAPTEPHWQETLFHALKAREDLCSTCVDDGVAIPHSRNALVGVVEKPMLGYGRHRAGIAFGALDGKPVHHFFLLCAPNVRQHLLLLARLARLIKEPAFRTALSTAEQPGQVLALIAAAETNLRLPS